MLEQTEADNLNPRAPQALTFFDQPKTGTRAFLFFLALALIAAFPGIAAGTRTFFYRDFAAYCYPLQAYTRASLLQGELPLWNPYTQCGVPLMAQLGQWYPPTLLALPLPMPWSANLLLLLHLFWAGWGMRWLAGRWGMGPFPASVAAVAYVFNGVMLSSLIWASYIAAFAWLPWLVGCVFEVWQHGGRWLVLGALSAAMQILSGMPEITALTWVFVGLLWLNALIGGDVKPGKSLLRTGSLVLLAAGLTLVQVLPFLDLLAHSQRNESSSTGAWSMPGWGWANLLVPLFHCYQAPDGQWFQQGQDMLQSYYLGAGVVALAAAGALASRRPFTPALLGMALFSWVMALGSNGFLYDWARRIIPILGYSRFPLKFALLTTFAVPLLAASGADHFLEDSTNKTNRATGVIVGLTLGLMGALLWFASKYPFRYDQWGVTAVNTLCRSLLMFLFFAGLFLVKQRKVGLLRLGAQITVLAVLPIDALTHNPRLAPTLQASLLAPGMWQASGKPAPPNLGEGRIMISPAAEQRLLYRHTANLLLDLGEKRLAEWYNFNLLDLVPKVNGALPLHPANFDLVEQRLYYTSGGHFGPGLLDFLSVSWYSCDDYPFSYSARTNYLPVLSGGQRAVFASDAQALEAILASDYDPRKIIYLADSDRSFAREAKEAHCTFQKVSFKPNQVQAEVTAESAALVVLSQTYYHLWQASIDDKPAHLLRANVAFQALEVPAGSHHIKLEYRDRNLVWGFFISMVSAFIGCAVWFRASSVSGASEG